MVVKKGVGKGVEFTSNNYLPISPQQREIYDLLINKNKTPKDISKIRKTSISAVYKTINKLKKKNIIKSGWTGGVEKVGITKFETSISHGIRLHRQEFNCKLLYQNDSYQRQYNKKNIIYLEGNTIRLYKNSIEIYAGKELSFHGIDAQEAWSKSMEYWNRIFNLVEQKLRVIIVKDQNTQIKVVNSHYSELDNGIAYDSRMKGEKIRIRGDHDGKVWALCDFSHSTDEFETVHPETSKEDMQKMQPYLNDYRNNNPATNSQLGSRVNDNAVAIGDMAEHIKKLAQITIDVTHSIDKFIEVTQGINKRLKVIEER